MLISPLSNHASQRSRHWWRGLSGRAYDHEVYQIQLLPAVRAANYIFARLRPDGFFDALYFGQSGNLHERLERHEKWLPATILGMTHVHIRLTENVADRYQIETDLRNMHCTPLNRQRSLTDLLCGR